MLSTLTLFVALFISTLTFMLGSGLLGTLLSLRMSLEGFDKQLIGIVMSGFYVGLTLGYFVCPPIVRRAGHIRAFAAFAALNTVSALLHPLFVSPPVWLLFRILTGISMMGMYMVIESWLNDRTEAHMRGRVFSVYMAMTFLGLGFGQLLLNLRDIGGSDLFMIVGIFFACSLIPVSLTRSVHPELPETVHIRVRKLLALAPMGPLGCFVAGMTASAFFSLAPMFAERIGLPLEMVAYFMGLTILCGFLVQWPFGSLSDRFDRQRILGAVSLLTSFACGGVILAAEHSVWHLFLAMGLFGGLSFPLYPISVAHTNDRIENHEIMAASTVLIFCYGLGACLGPIGAATLMSKLGPPGLYVFIAIITTIFGITVILYQFLEKPKAEEQVPYIPVPRTSPIINVIHPHSETDETGDDVLPEDEPVER